MDYSINVLIKKDGESLFEKSRSASEMKKQQLTQTQLHTDSEPLPLLKEGDMYNLCLAVDSMKEEVGAFLSGIVNSNKYSTEAGVVKKPRLDDEME